MYNKIFKLDDTKFFLEQAIREFTVYVTKNQWKIASTAMRNLYTLWNIYEYKYKYIWLYGIIITNEKIIYLFLLIFLLLTWCTNCFYMTNILFQFSLK